MLHISTEQLSSLKTGVRDCPKGTFIIGKEEAGKSIIKIEIWKTVTEQLGPEAIMVAAPTSAS